jgi:hypothetical protein
MAITTRLQHKGAPYRLSERARTEIDRAINSPIIDGLFIQIPPNICSENIFSMMARESICEPI